MTQYYAPPPPVQPPKKNRHLIRKSVIGIGGAAVAIAVISIASGTNGGKPHKTTPTTPQRSVQTSFTPPPVSSSPTFLVPTKDNYRISLKILTKDCFGEAGCNVSYRPQLTETFAQGSTDPSVTYDVTYVVSGGQSGEQIDTIQVTGDQYQSTDGFTQTASSTTKLTVKITDVEAE